MITILDPKCFKELPLAITNQGYLIPCCYCDDPETLNDPEFKKLLSVSKIADNNCIEDIINSKQWIQFYKKLKKHKGPPACIKTCQLKNRTRRDVHIINDNKKRKIRKV